METKKIILNELRSKIMLNELRPIVRQIIKEELDTQRAKESVDVVLYANEFNGGMYLNNPKSRENTLTFRKMKDAIENNITVNFKTMYINEKGGVTVPLVSGKLTPKVTGREGDKIQVVNLQLYSQYTTSGPKNYEGEQLILEAFTIIENYSQSSADGFIKR